MDKKMRFIDYLELMASLMPCVTFGVGSPAFIDCMRLWNTQAILHPEKCADVVVWTSPGMTPITQENNLVISEARLILKDRKLANLPDNVRQLFRSVTAQSQIEQSSKKEKEKVKIKGASQAETPAGTTVDQPVMSDIHVDQTDSGGDNAEIHVPDHAK